MEATNIQIPFRYDHQGSKLQSTFSMLRPTRKSSLQVQEVHDCRICLESSMESGQKLITACQCRGSVGYVHQECLKKWIMKTIRSEEEVVSCELCHQKYNYEIIYSKQWSWEKFMTKIKKQTTKTVAIVLIYLIFLVGNLFFTYLISQASQEPQNSQLKRKLFFTPHMRTIWIILSTFIYIMLLLLGISFFINYCLKKTMDIEVYPYAQKLEKMRFKAFKTDYRIFQK